MWSLGVTMFLVMGRCFPFYDEDQGALFRAIVKGHYEFNERWSGVSESAKVRSPCGCSRHVASLGRHALEVGFPLEVFIDLLPNTKMRSIARVKRSSCIILKGPSSDQARTRATDSAGGSSHGSVWDISFSSLSSGEGAHMTDGRQRDAKTSIRGRHR